MSEEFEKEMAEQHACEHMRGPWVVEEQFNSDWDNYICVTYRAPGVQIMICHWDMNGIARGSPAYFMIRAHAELIARAPELKERFSDERSS